MNSFFKSLGKLIKLDAKDLAPSNSISFILHLNLHHTDFLIVQIKLNYDIMIIVISCF